MTDPVVVSKDESVSSQDTEFDWLVYLPEGHAKHAVARVVGEYLPAGHDKHELGKLQLSSWHSSQCSDAGMYWPVGQSSHPLSYQLGEQLCPPFVSHVSAREGTTRNSSTAIFISYCVGVVMSVLRRRAGVVGGCQTRQTRR